MYPPFLMRPGEKMINYACPAILNLVAIRSSSNQMHASSACAQKCGHNILAHIELNTSLCM
jgi:hypothetical protein